MTKVPDLDLLVEVTCISKFLTYSLVLILCGSSSSVLGPSIAVFAVLFFFISVQSYHVIPPANTGHVKLIMETSPAGNAIELVMSQLMSMLVASYVLCVWA